MKRDSPNFITRTLTLPEGVLHIRLQWLRFHISHQYDFSEIFNEVTELGIFDVTIGFSF